MIKELRTSSEEQRFNEHLNLENNSHIIFSGIFGIGKTYFLNKFFQKRAKEFEVFKISPVNYSISDNSDIIEYIKYDLAIQLLGKGIDFKKVEIPKSLSNQFYITNNIADIVGSFIEHSGKIGKSISGIIKSFKNLEESLKEYNKANETDDLKEIKNYLESLSLEKGTLYEDNRISDLINCLLDQCSGKNKVLVIEDLDRLDPDHIFRILNVFASHFDKDVYNNNKFLFDKIILVCDINNIRNIFTAKYGLNVDFTGYIDKFYSNEIFFYDNKKVIQESLGIFLNTPNLTWPFGSKINVTNKNKIDRFTLDLFSMLIKFNLLSFRTLEKFHNRRNIIDPFYFLPKSNSTLKSSESVPIILVFQLLIKVFESEENVKSALSRLSIETTNRRLEPSEIIMYGDLIHFLNQKHLTPMKNNETNNKSLSIDELDIAFHYTINFHVQNDTENITLTAFNYIKERNNGVAKREDFPYGPLVLKAFIEFTNLYKRKID